MQGSQSNNVVPKLATSYPFLAFQIIMTKRRGKWVTKEFFAVQTHLEHFQDATVRRTQSILHFCVQYKACNITNFLLVCSLEVSCSSNHFRKCSLTIFIWIFKFPLITGLVRSSLWSQTEKKMPVEYGKILEIFSKRNKIDMYKLRNGGYCLQFCPRLVGVPQNRAYKRHFTWNRVFVSYCVAVVLRIWPQDERYFISICRTILTNEVHLASSSVHMYCPAQRLDAK